ncbi:MAG: DNA-binding protein [Elusimicrobia bacterium RIFOXYA2_FULL_40_6]|nr:MAG: DNA-binding protein [Elusimicrobia bacterium RIFOXYA2_FULL_40_6]
MNHEQIERKIFIIRGQKVMIDRDLAELYGVQTKVLNQAVKRNIERFPDEFMFNLTWEEAKSLRSQFVTLEETEPLKQGEHIKHLPFAFTEQGIAMLSSVLRSKQAIQVNIAIIKTFVKIRQYLSTHAELRKKVEELEKNYDGKFRVVFNELAKILYKPESKLKANLGFQKD